MSQRIKVLYLSGWGRSGSTVIGNLLGQVEGFHHVGELRAWDAAYLDERGCGCGAAFRECDFWRRSLGGALGELDVAAAEAFRKLRWNHTRYRHLPAMLGPHAKDRVRRRLPEYLSALERLYRSIAETGESQVVVDSSKFATYAWLVDLIPSLELRVVHLVRDPRAVAHSWMRKKTHADIGRQLRRYDPASSALLWTFWNGTSDALFRHRAHRVRYEDFVRSPEKLLRSILEFAGESQRDIGFVEDHQVAMSFCNHTVLGNPGGVTRGRIELRADEAWRRELGRGGRMMVAGLSAPLLLRYGYHRRNPEW